ncbi:MAG: hypothetical protein OXG42_06235 [Chloroflexi bacterium]|nr:hypothetical protein [Chloroflexota bacterium]
MRLLVVLFLFVALIAACGSDADKPLHRQASEAFKQWADSFETAEYSTTALGVGEQPTGDFDFEGEARYRRDPESVWTILYLSDADSEDERESFQQLRVEDEEFIWDFSFWRHVGDGDDSQSIALERELRSMLGTPIITDDQVLERWLECADRSFGATSLEAWRDQPAWIVRCRAHAGIEDPDERAAARELVKSVMATLFGQAPGATAQLEELIEAAEVGFLIALQAVVHRESGALMMVDVAITLAQEGARSDIRWQTELVSFNVPIEFPDLRGVLRN